MTHRCRPCGQTLPRTTEYFYPAVILPNGTQRLDARCRACRRKGTKAWRIAHPEKARESMRRWTTTHKAQIAEKHKRYHAKYRDRIVRRVSAWRRLMTISLRSEMVAAYGGCCTCCGESHPSFLTLEHLRGGGRAHVKACGGNLATLRKLKSLGWPKDDFTVLCFNCNLAKAKDGRCPHEQLWAERLANGSRFVAWE